MFEVIHSPHKDAVLEIDENLKRLDLTVWEQAKHGEERERVLAVLGQRASRGDNQHGGPVTVTGPNTTASLAQEAGVSERTWQRRTEIGRDMSERTSPAVGCATTTTGAKERPTPWRCVSRQFTR